MWGLRSDILKSIEKARKRVTQLFVQQCSHGSQLHDLGDTMTACGQFLDDGADQLVQRGLHGTAGGLRVIASSNDTTAPTLVPRLVSFLTHYFDESGDSTAQKATQGKSADDVAADRTNVIKIGEVLYALSFVQTAHAKTDALVKRLIDRLTSALIQGKGWGYFTDGESRPELLPTAYAIRGLASHGVSVDAPVSFLVDALHKAARRDYAQQPVDDITTHIACLFAVAFQKPLGHGDTGCPDIPVLLRPMWKAMEPLLRESIEQNVEYWRGRSTSLYVRVPWQLYLLALASKYSFAQFSTYAAQAHFNRTLTALIDGNFRYPHSGRMLSSRTNAIALDVISFIEAEVQAKSRLWLVYAFDRARIVAGSWPVRFLGMALAVVCIVYALWDWRDTNGHWGDVAPHAIWAAIAVLFVTSVGRR